MTDIMQLFEQARDGTLPQGFDGWDLTPYGARGLTVAHVAAINGHLSPDFDQWELANDRGSTVAHRAAQYGHLPPDFDRWELANARGWTVAHDAARWGNLPPDFDQWELSDKNGVTVARVAALNASQEAMK
ncbi:hypothetical protein [Thiolapillus sp.]|uniref:hypothetical protein n=1 Tax=Thiolapillus sp. TaxID=2017437 RepID=UPI003AF57B2A